MSDGEKTSPFQFAPQYLGNLTRFPRGVTKIEPEGITPGYYDKDEENPESAKTVLERICQKMGDYGTDDALVVIVGGTDRLPLGGELRTQFDTNAGLGMARAIETKKYLDEHCRKVSGEIQRPDIQKQKPKYENILLLSSGPRTTPSAQNQKVENDGYPRDRRVDVWILSKIPAPLPAANSKESPAGSGVSGGSSGGF